MDFNIAIWKAKLQFDNLRQKATALGVDSIYGLCIAASLWPALEALKSGDINAILGVGAAIGTSLVANHLEDLKNTPPSEHPTYLAKTIKNDEGFRQDVRKLLTELDSLSIALSQNENDSVWLEEKLNEELAQWCQAIEVDRSIHVHGEINEAIFNTGDYPVFHVTIMEKQEITYPPPNPLAAEQARKETARQEYLKQLYNHCQELPLEKFGEANTYSARVKLDDVYIELFTTTPRDPEKARKSNINNENYLSAWEAAQKSELLVILGDPGSGKSTFAKRLLGRLCLAEMGQIPTLDGFPSGMTPVLVNLRDLVPELQGVAFPQNSRERKRRLQNLILKQAINDVESEYRTPEFLDGMSRAITTGTCFLVLDGFDEVPQSLRGLVREAVAAILVFRPLRVLATCRIRSYTGQAILNAFKVHSLAPLGIDQIRRFCHDWYECQSELNRISSIDCLDKAENFIKAATDDEKLRELAGNPMLLTTMAIVHQKETHLPPERVKLFQEVVKILLFRWQKHHGNEHLKGSLSKLLADESMLLRSIEHLAYAAHRAGKGDKKAADLPRKLFRDILEDQYLGAAQLAEDFLDYIDQRSGILIGRGGEPDKPHTYAFPHRFLQEYLAGCHLASEQDPYVMVNQFKAIAEEGDFWDEAARLAFEELKHNRTSSSLWYLADELVKDCDLNNPCHQRLVMWSGQIANLIGRKTLEEGGNRGKRYLNKLEPMLLKTAQEILLNPMERADSADALDSLGYEPEDLFKFIEIPSDNQSYNFWIGKYPVTNLQYERFLVPKNFSNRSLWIDLPDYSETGQVKGTIGVEGWCWLQDNIASEKILFPSHWNNPGLGKKRHCAPVVGISWYEAMAYGRWLQKNWFCLIEAKQNNGLTPKFICLPIDYEWEKAAGGISNNRFSWDKPGENSNLEKVIMCANTDESYIRSTTQVWLYPQGQSYPYGIFDMCGNVEEWQAVPHEDALDCRVLRDGSFNSPPDLARCVIRHWSKPNSRNSTEFGFRLCLHT